MKLVRSVVWSLTVLALGACGANTGSETAATPTSIGSPRTSTPSPTSPTPPSGSATAERCRGTSSVTYHGAPALEATLPTRVAGRDLATWSVAGRCWLEILIDDDAMIAAMLAAAGDPSAVDLSHLAQAVAGRSDTTADPPYFVLAANRPERQEEIDLTLGLLLGGASFRDPAAAADLSNYRKASIAGKEVYVGTTDMIEQTDHQRGTPYLYQTDSAMYVVITDDAAWAEEAFAQLP
jgi:hypothetical protein